nr:reverse transcriptase domain-containing protein [Tanacetum cinerariifolium]
MREDSQNSSAKTLSARYRNPSDWPQIRDRLRNSDGNVFGQLGHRRESTFKRLSDTYSPSATKSRPDKEYSKDNSYSRGSPSRDRPRSRGRSSSIKRGRNNESSLSRVSESGTSEGGHWKSRSKRRDPEDHVKIFQAAPQVERWAMPTWCHMFNSTLIGAARVWFDELPSESIDGYKDLKASFLAYFMQQKKYVKDPVEIQTIKQRDGETIEEFMEWFKVETERMKGAPECMQISGFMHGVNNPELTKRLNEHVPNTMKEMMIATTAFIRGEAAAADKKKGHASWRTQDQSKRHTSEKRSDFRGRKVPAVTTHVKKQIEELVRACKLSHLIKEIKQGRDQPKVGKKETPAKDKSMAIYMIQSWHRMTRQKVTQSFERVREIVFPSMTNNNGTEGTLVIEAEIGGHMIHRMLLVTIRDVDHSTRAWMNFMIVRSLSPYNYIIGRPGIKEIYAVPSTAHGMLKFPADRRIVTIRSTILIPAECTTVITSSNEIPKEAGVCHKNFKVALHPNFPNQGIRPFDRRKRDQASKRVKAIQAEDCYPLPEIDWKVESLCGYPLKCFLDAYKGYHQIQLVESDEEKTAFHTGQGVYCYTKMPFGLNVPAAEAEMLRDIGETFRTLRKINMKLNPKKFTFGGAEGMLLGYMISPEGINLCPDKTEVVLQLPSPRTIKEVQSLNGKLASLNRFLSKSAEKSLPLFKTLKKCIKKSDFHWTSEAKQAVNQLKQHLSELPLLVAPKPKEELIVYLSASHGAISAVLMTERGQILADFLAEMSDESPPDASVVETPQEPWTLFTDGSSCVDGSSAGLILISPEGTEFTCPEQDCVNQLCALIQTSLGRNTQRKIHTREGGDNCDRGRWTNMDDTNNRIFKKGTLFGDRKEARKFRIKARQYELLEGVLYMRSFLTPWLICVRPLQTDYVIREIHKGSCSMHAGP